VIKELKYQTKFGERLLSVESGNIQLTLMPGRDNPHRPQSSLVLTSVNYASALDVEGIPAMEDLRDKIDLAIRYAQDIGAGDL